jgi:hypothetical protein
MKPAWTGTPRGGSLLVQVNEVLIRVQRIQLLAKLVREKRRLETEALIRKAQSHVDVDLAQSSK